MGLTTERLVNWLLSDEVQLSNHPHAGGVLGWFDRDASAGRFVYPEITGYYLTFLSFLHAHDWPAEGLQLRARRAANWLAQWIAQTPPRTRVYLAGPQTKDWRNHFSFSFDLAMIWRGLAAARPFLDDVSAGPIRLSIEQHLTQFCIPRGGLLASLPVQPGPVGPSWSARPGPFQMKAAAALLYSGLPVDSHLQQTSHATLHRFRHSSPRLTVTRAHLHPCLYAAEGALLAGVAADDRSLLCQAAAAIDRVASGVDDSRSDVLAQLLRSGCILHAAGYLPQDRWAVRLPELAAALCRYCVDGRMYFQRDSAGRLKHVNVWSGLFAAQALIWYTQWRASTLTLPAASWLV